MFPNFWGKELLLETFITTLCACFVVCLFRKKTHHRLRDVNDDAYFKEEDEEDEDKEEDTSSAIIFRWISPFWLKVVVFFVCLRRRRLSMRKGLCFGRGISPPPPPPNVCAFVVTACLCRRRRVDDKEEQTRRTTTIRTDSRSDALV